jgi:hypothetical protein
MVSSGGCAGADEGVVGQVHQSEAQPTGRGIAGRVLTLVWSEFGRRAQQNDSNARTTARPGSHSLWERARTSTWSASSRA